MKTVLITGGTGFIGSRLALECLRRGHFVRVLGQENTAAEVTNRELLNAQGAEIVLGTVTDSEALLDLLQGVDVVFHLAAAQHEANVPDQRFWDVNVAGTKNVLEASVQTGVSRFVHGSTIGVYGAKLEGNINQHSPEKPDNIYGKTKLEGEKVVSSYAGKLPVVIVRISETYGPGDFRLLKLFKMIKKRTFFMIGNGQNRHHLIYVDDLIDGLLLSATVKRAVGETFVLAGRETVTTEEMVTTIADVMGTKIGRLRAPLFPLLLLAIATESVLRPFGIQPPLHRRRMDFFKKSFTFSIEHPANILGFTPRHTFRQGIIETAQWYTQMKYL